MNAETVSDRDHDDSTEAQDTVTGDDATASDAKTQNEEHNVSELRRSSIYLTFQNPSQSQEEKDSQPISSPADHL